MGWLSAYIKAKYHIWMASRLIGKSKKLRKKALIEAKSSVAKLEAAIKLSELIGAKIDKHLKRAEEVLKEL